MHRLVYQAFNPTEDIIGKDIDHIDGNRANNNLSNLRSCDRYSNIAYGYIRRWKLSQNKL